LHLKENRNQNSAQRISYTLNPQSGLQPEIIFRIKSNLKKILKELIIKVLWQKNLHFRKKGKSVFKEDLQPEIQV